MHFAIVVMFCEQVKEMTGMFGPNLGVLGNLQFAVKISRFC